jgi:hypothetical protein
VAPEREVQRPRPSRSPTTVRLCGWSTQNNAARAHQRTPTTSSATASPWASCRLHRPTLVRRTSGLRWLATGRDKAKRSSGPTGPRAALPIDDAPEFRGAVLGPCRTRPRQHTQRDPARPRLRRSSMRALDEQKLANSTARVVFTTDNGPELGTGRRAATAGRPRAPGRKRSLLMNGGIRVPGLSGGGPQSRGTTSDVPVVGHRLVPDVLGRRRGAPRPTEAGRGRRAAVLTARPRRSARTVPLYWRLNKRPAGRGLHVAIQQDGWKPNWRPRLDKSELYDLSATSPGAVDLPGKSGPIRPDAAGAGVGWTPRSAEGLGLVAALSRNADRTKEAVGWVSRSAAPTTRGTRSTCGVGAAARLDPPYDDAAGARRSRLCQNTRTRSTGPARRHPLTQVAHGYHRSSRGGTNSSIIARSPG